MIIPKLKRIFLVLGNECNFNCKYCLQHQKRNQQISAKVNSEVLYFLKMNALNFDPIKAKRKKLGLTFFGGEPFLYKNTIKQVVSELDNFKNRMKFTAITNGEYVDEEWVNYLNKHNFFVSVSWDGRNVEKTRGKDILKENWNNISKLDGLFLISTSSNLNYTIDFLDDTLPYRKEYQKIHNRDIPLIIEKLNNKCHNCDDIAKYDFDRVKKDSEILVKAFDENDDSKGYLAFAKKSMRKAVGYYLCKRLVHRNSCGNGYTTINIDISGNMFLCHNDGYAVANVTDTYDEYLSKMKAYDRYDEMIENLCKNCDMKLFCQGHCVLMDDETKKSYFCDWQHANWGPFIEYLDKHPEVVQKLNSNSEVIDQISK